MIALPLYLQKSDRIMPRISEVAGSNGFEFARPNPERHSFAISWGNTQPGIKNCVLETGFFWDGAHIDTCGLYKHSAFNTVWGSEAFTNYTPPEHAMDVIAKSGLQASKYRQVDYSVKWNGVVLALQNPGDRSVLSCGSVEDYYNFVEGACRYYGKYLFLKAHPWNIGEVFERLKSYSDQYGCRIEKTNHSVIEHCKFVLVYNSTFSVDCFVRGVPVVQFAPGYFYQTGAVYYSNGEYVDEVPKEDTLVDMGLQLADFLIWRYCFNIAMPKEKWVMMLEHFASGNDIFPVTEEYSYAANVEYSKK